MWNYKITHRNNSKNGGRKCKECGSAEFGEYRSEIFCSHCGLVVGKEQINY